MADQRRTSDPQTPSQAQGDQAGKAPASEGISANPQEDWGDPAGEGAAYSANHGRRGEKSDAVRGPGPKTRKATKDTISRRL